MDDQKLNTTLDSDEESAGQEHPDFGDHQSRTQGEGTAYSMAERLKMIRSVDTDILPQPPVRPGWHYCWLSTSNKTDPIYRRLQQGYELVKSEELPGWVQMSVTQGEYEGLVGCNEMVLARIPSELYQEAMKYFHHELPMSEEGRLRDSVKEEKAIQDSGGRELLQQQGFDALVKKARSPANFIE